MPTHTLPLPLNTLPLRVRVQNPTRLPSGLQTLEKPPRLRYYRSINRGIVKNFVLKRAAKYYCRTLLKSRWRAINYNTINTTLSDFDIGAEEGVDWRAPSPAETC